MNKHKKLLARNFWLPPVKTTEVGHAMKHVADIRKMREKLSQQQVCYDAILTEKTQAR